MAAIGTILGDVAGAATSGPATGIAAILDAANSIIGKFVTDPAAKLEASQHLVDLQYQLQTSQMAQQTAEAAQAGQNIQHDNLTGPRSVFCYAVIVGFLWNYVLCKFVHQTPTEIPGMYIAAFVALMLGTAGVQAAQSVALAPGDSTVSLLGFKLGNKS
jgi:hypothetical protein